jgi:hypothetical protein
VRDWFLLERLQLRSRLSRQPGYGRPPRKTFTNPRAGLAQCGLCGGGLVAKTADRTELQRLLAFCREQ